jgi:hypothetical protein
MKEKVKNFVRAIAGLQDRVRTQDHLDVQIKRAPKVIGIHCGHEPYYLSIDAKGRRKFVPTETQKEVRTDLRCPLCLRMLCAYEKGRSRLKTDQGWK